MEKRTKQKIAFVILHYGDRSVTDACVQSIRQMEQQERIYTIIVDNEIAKPESERLDLKQHYEKRQHTAVITVRDNGGFSHANNLGYQYAREVLHASFILILNNDIEFVQRDFPELLDTAYEKEPCHILGPDIVRRGTGEHQNPMDVRLRTKEEAEYTIRMNRLALKYYGFLYPLLYWKQKRAEQNLTQERKRREEDYRVLQKDIIPFGACLIFTPLFTKKEKLAFTPETQFYYEEYILAYRCRRAEYRVFYTPQLLVFHESGAATEKTYRNQKARLKFVMERTMQACEIYHSMLNQSEAEGTERL